MKKYYSIIFLLSISHVFAQQKQAQIIVGPNIQVTYDGNSMHCESMLAANPNNPDILVGATTKGFPNYHNVEEWGCSKAYITKDGGNSWEDMDFPYDGGADPQVAFDLHGRAYFMMFGHVNRGEELIYSNVFYQSDDEMTTWSKPMYLDKVSYGLPKGYDHPQIAVDNSFGPFAGRLYITGCNNDENGKGQCWLIRSDDGGKSIVGPIKLPLPSKAYSPFVATNILISTKGASFFTYTYTYSETYIISSKDGGITFSTPRLVFNTGVVQSTNTRGKSPQFAIDNKSENYRDRIYCVFPDTIDKKERLVLTYSKDEGETWSKPTLIDKNCPSNAFQYTAAIAVNSKGVVGIRWYDTRNTTMEKGFDEYFTASLDGGETFLSPVKVSSVTSVRPDFSNEIVRPMWGRSLDKDSIRISFLPGSTLQYRDLGQCETSGDYCQFTADAKGVFHDFWSDARDAESYQMYSSAIKVITPDEDAEKAKMEFGKRFKKEKKEINVSSNCKGLKQIARYISLHFGQLSYDTITNLLSTSLQIKNISDKPIYGPLKLEISKIDTSKGAKNGPVFNNLDDVLSSTKLESMYTKYFDDSFVLLPGKESKNIQLKFHVPIRKKIIPFNKAILKIMQKNYKTNKTYRVECSVDVNSDLYINLTGYMIKEN